MIAAESKKICLKMVGYMDRHGSAGKFIRLLKNVRHVKSTRTPPQRKIIRGIFIPAFYSSMSVNSSGRNKDVVPESSLQNLCARTLKILQA
jgi:hypothetical protein